MLSKVSCVDFDSKVLSSRVPTVVEFSAGWCGPCKAMKPMLENLSVKYKGKVEFCEVCIDDDEDLAVEYHISAVPTLLVFKNGAIIGNASGAMMPQDVEGLFKMAL